MADGALLLHGLQRLTSQIGLEKLVVRLVDFSRVVVVLDVPEPSECGLLAGVDFGDLVVRAPHRGPVPAQNGQHHEQDRGACNEREPDDQPHVEAVTRDAVV